MKNLFASALFSSLVSTTVFAAAPSDTIVVKLGNKDKMMLIVEKSNRISNIQQYDLNSIVKRVDSTLNQQSALYKTDANGNKVLKDTTITVQANKQDKSIIEITTSKGKRVIVRTDSEVIINESDSSGQERTIRRSRPRTHNDFDLDFGLTNFTENVQGKPYNLNPLGSRYVALRWLYKTRIGAEKSPFSVKYGLEIAWNNYMFDEDVRMHKMGNQVAFLPDSTVNIKKSKLTTAFLNVPVTFQYKKKNFRFGLGGFAGYRLASYNKVKYVQEGSTKRDRNHDNFNLNNWQYGLKATIGIKEVDFFVNYHLSELFTANKGPKLTPFSFGVTF